LAFAPQDRPHCRLVLKLNLGVIEQVGSICFCLVQSRYDEFYTYSSPITALDALFRAITTSSLTAVTTPLATPALEEIAGSLYPAP
jgi:hypothetical protein